MARKDYDKQLKKVVEALEAAGKSCEKTEDKKLEVPCPGKATLVFGPAMPHHPPDRKPFGGVEVSWHPMGIPSKLVGPLGLPVNVQGKGSWPAVGAKNDERNADQMDPMRAPSDNPPGSTEYVRGPDGKVLDRTPEQERQRMLAAAVRDDPDLEKEIREWKKKIKCAKNKPPCDKPVEYRDPDNPESDSGLDVQTYVEMESGWLTKGVTVGMCVKYRFKCDQVVEKDDFRRPGYKEEGDPFDDPERGGGGAGPRNKGSGSRRPVLGAWGDRQIDPLIEYVRPTWSKTALTASRLVDYARLVVRDLDAPHIPTPMNGPQCDSVFAGGPSADTSPYVSAGTLTKRDVSGLVTVLHAEDASSGWARRSAFWQAAHVFDRVVTWLRSVPRECQA